MLQQVLIIEKHISMKDFLLFIFFNSLLKFLFLRVFSE